jgi:hypothetical protein
MNQNRFQGFIDGLEQVAIVEPWHQKQYRMEKGPLHLVTSV